jgi:hypothetical protein
MSDKLKAGDLAVVSRVDHECAVVHLLGKIVKFDPATVHPGVYCPGCGQRNVAYPNELIHRRSTGEGGVVHGFPARWLKRIPPLSELESEKQKEDLREPV